MTEREVVTRPTDTRTGEPIVRPGVLAPALAAVLCLVLTIVAWRVFVQTTRGQLVEEAARIGSADTRESLAGLTGILLGAVSVPLLVLVVVGAVLVSLVQRRWWIAIAAIIVLCGANLTTQVLQDQLTRPVQDASAISSNSFPSGHATVAASVAATALLVVPLRWRPAVALVGTLLTASMGISTMIGANDVGAWHRASDVVAAMLISTLWYFAAEAVIAATAPRHEQGAVAASPAGLRAVLRILGAVGGLTAALGVGALAATAVRAPITTDLGYQVAFVGSVLGVAAVACFTQASMLRLRPHHPGPADSD